MKRTASAQWKGSLKEGRGTISSASGVLRDTPYSFSTRVEDAKGTKPEELVAAAHAGCFSMALSAQLTQSGTPPDRVDTTAPVTLEKQEQGFAVTSVHLDVVARVPGATQDAFDGAAQTAKATCPISKLLNAEITMTARLDA